MSSPIYPPLRIGVLLALLVGRATETQGQVPRDAGHALGTVDFPVSCSPQAQAEFDQAIALLHHMTYPQAREAFRRVATIDSTCALAHWGIAMTLFQPLWPTRPGPEALQQGWDAVEKAKALHPPTERERFFVAAAAAFFLEPGSQDYWLRIRRWQQAMQRVSRAFPDDADAAAFYALAILATAPSDTISRAASDRAADILLRLYERHPDHPGIMHYLIHANDVWGRERESPEVPHTYETVAPRNPHALHMPTHIYTRLGDWDRVIQGNAQAAAAALEYPAGPDGTFVWDEFPHAIEYLVYAYLQQGADDDAAAQLTRLQATPRLEPSFKTAFHLASTNARYALERRDWTEAARLVPREPTTLDWDRFPWAEAITRFARGLGAARLGNVDAARTEEERLEALDAAARRIGEDVFARNIRVLSLELKAWLAHTERQDAASVALMQEAAALEAPTPKHPVTPGPTLPASELLGDLLMEQTRPAEALAAYRHALELYPRRFNSILGAARAARALGDDAIARSFYQALLDVARGGTRQAALAEAANYLAPRR